MFKRKHPKASGRKPDQVVMDFEKQIEEILASTENRELIQNFANLGKGFAIFFFSLKNNGLSEYEAMELTKQYINSVVEAAKQ